MEDLKQEFLSEAFDLLNTMEDGCLRLEQNPNDSEAINGIFRVAHTLKGGSASLELTRIAEFTHELENLLDNVRDNKIKVDDTIIDIILKSLDILKTMVNAAAKSVEAPEGIEKETLEKIIQVQKNPNKAGFSSTKKEIQETKPVDFALTDYEKEKILEAYNTQKQVYRITVFLNSEYAMRSVSGLQVYTALKEIGEIISSVPHIDSILEEDFIPRIDFLFISSLTKENIYQKIFISDATDRVEINFYEKKLEGAKEPIQNTSQNEETSLLSPEVKNKINKNLAAGKNVYKITVEIEHDNPMRTVDSLLIYNTLEGMGEILSSLPTKEDLKKDVFFDKIDIIISSHESKEKLKEKCTISGSTKNVKIAIFKPKESINKEETEKTVTKKEEKQEIAAVEKKVNLSQSNFKSSESEEEKEEKRDTPITTQTSAHKSFLKVESNRIDTLMNLVSELVISKAGLIETAQQILFSIENLRTQGAESRKILEELLLVCNNGSKKEDDEKTKKIQDFYDFVTKSSWSELDSFENIINIISRVINELQESVMKIRMIPISSIFNRFPRIVRDLSKTINKKVDLEIYGEDTELDKSVIEELLDPLVHMVRNSIDHGIETPEERIKKGKKETGKVILRASHEGSMIKIEIEDDGNGLNAERIKAKAIEKGLIPENKELSKEEMLNLIFMPGFSTASTITEISGRGVGMDVVKKKIDNLSGSIFAETEKGKGTRFIIKIPLTLAIIQALIVEINGYSYSIPINNIVETLSITEDQIENFENNRVIRLRDEIITVINIKEIFNFKEDQTALEDTSDTRTKGKKNNKTEILETLETDEEMNLKKEKYIVVVELSNKKAGLLVDTVVAEQDIVIKPLHKKYAMTKGISGATILGDGRISLIIDISQLIDMYIKREDYISIR